MFIKLRRKLFHLANSEKLTTLLKSLDEETSHDCKTNILELEYFCQHSVHTFVGDTFCYVFKEIQKWSSG